MEFKWKNITGFTASTILAEIQKMMAELRCEPEQFQGRIIVMPLYNDIVLGERGNGENCIANSSFNVAAYAKKVPARMVGHFWTWLREEVVRNPCQQTRRRTGQAC